MKTPKIGESSETERVPESARSRVQGASNRLRSSTKANRIKRNGPAKEGSQCPGRLGIGDG